MSERAFGRSKQVQSLNESVKVKFSRYRSEQALGDLEG